ncbi:helix-turn-helix domain-containing protein [Micromonospora tulbaghiae]|uniref:helix-turn-helix domain-containing protein n=1 Tax=Micromonospora tulbaghiae TaxID=479978 RepID=UPI003326C865
MEKLCYTPTEAAALLGVGRTKVYELMSSGQIASIRIGRSRRIPANALRAFVEACQQEAA